MAIKKLQKKQWVQSNTRICLQSLQLIQTSDKYICSKKSISPHITIKPSKVSFTPIFNNLCIAWNIFNLSIQNRQQIAIILNYCSGSHFSHKCEQKQAGQKYFGRFSYKYGKQYMSVFQLIANNEDKKPREGCATATIALYTIYKILKANDKFSNCRKSK